MTTTKTRDVAATVAQIARLEEAGCDLIRVAVLDMKDARALGEIKAQITLPLVADIHFRHDLALEALQQGVDKLRLNPGNLRRREQVEEVVKAAAEHRVPIRIGVNAGSVPEAVRARHEGEGSAQEQLAAAMVEAALEHVEILEGLDFRDIVVSLKAFDLPTTWRANRRFRELRDYPLHLGITEAGLASAGSVRSAVGLGVMLHEGLGDTIRVSLTGDPERQVRVGREILKALELDTTGVTLVSCPTCGRCEVDLPRIASAVEEALQPLDRALRRARRSIRVAVMGCVVNGPGEAKEADVGIACGLARGSLFVRGEPVATLAEAELVPALVKAAREVVGE
jgi:(E)-4-hydroxy-3-methylbut-2-enyl-diphosphate synthase